MSYRAWVSAGALLAIGCGGRSESASMAAPEPDLTGRDTAGTTSSAGSSTATGGAATAAGGRASQPTDPSDVCEASPSSLEVSKVWERAVYMYGLGSAPYFAFSSTGKELMVPTDQYGMVGHRLYAVADGALLEMVAPRVLDRDTAWSRELRVSDEYSTVEVTLLDLVHGGPPLALDSRSRLVRLSPDGRYWFGWYGQNLERRRIADGEVTAVSLAAEARFNQQGYSDDYPPPFVVNQDSRLVAVATGGTTVTVADFGSGAATATALYDETSTSLLTLALAPSENALATVDGAGTLRLWRYPALSQYGRETSLGVTRAFDDCYCAPRRFSPVAWSADQRYLATRDELGGTVVRRACDGTVLLTLPPFTSPEAAPNAHPGPAFLAFTPRGDGLAVIHLTRHFDGVIAYYALSE